MKDPIPAFVVARFGTPSARPHATRGYAVKTGWVQIDHGPELTEVALQQMKEAGYSMIEARWHRRVREISLVRLA